MKKIGVSGVVVIAAVCFGQQIPYPIQIQSKPFISVTDAPYLAKTDGTDARLAIRAALTGAAKTGSCVYFPAGTYRIDSTLSWTGSICVHADAGAILLYSGAGTAVSLTNPSGAFDDLAIRSTTGTARVGLDILSATEFFSDRLYVGGAPRSSFGIGIRLRASSGEFNHLTSSWNATGILLDTYSSANSLVTLLNGAFFQARSAGIQITDVGPLVVKGNAFEAVQNAILLDNKDGPVVATGVIDIANNSALLLASENGVTFANPQFISIKARNPSNPLNIKSFNVSQNNVGGTPGAYCNTLLKVGSGTGTNYNLFFNGNIWQDCTASAIYGDIDSVAVISTNETRPVGVPEFAGGMYGIDSRLDSTGIVALTYYGAYLPLPYVSPASGVASSVTVFSAGSQSQIIECNSTANGDAAVLFPSHPGAGQVITVKKIDAATHNCVVEPQGKTIDGSPGKISLNQTYGYGTFWYDGIGWWVLSRN